MYGKDAFVSQSVWSDNEDDVSLGNKPRDMMGLDALADNIISAEFTDDNEKLFNVHKFIDLNKDTDPEMGLNFQYR